MPSITFCADEPQLRILLGLIAGVPFGVAVAAGAYWVASHLGSGAIVRYFRRACALLAFFGVAGSSMVVIGGPCAFAGGSSRFGVTGSYSNTPTTLGARLEVVWFAAIFLSLFFALVLSGRGTTSHRG